MERYLSRKHNLKEMMQFFTEAHQLGLFVPPHRREEKKEQENKKSLREEVRKYGVDC